MRFGHPVLTYARDRRLVVVTMARLAACVAVVVADVAVPVPTSDLPLPVESFLALAFALPAAITLPERLEWLGSGPSSGALRAIRTVAGAAADALCLAAILTTSRISHHPVQLGGPLLAVGVGYLASILTARMSWLVVAALGTIGLLTFAHSPQAAIDYVPVGLGAAVFWLGFVAYVAVGPRSGAHDRA